MAAGPSTPQGNVSAVAILLHGKIGIWSVKSAFVPGRDRQPSKYLAAAVSDAPKAPPRESNTSLWELERWPHSMQIGFARFASVSIREHVIEANRRAGVRVDVFLHSWHPDFGRELDRMYAPIIASRHDPPEPVHKVKSHHLSMQRGLALIAAHQRRLDRVGEAYELFMVMRFDLTFYSPLRFTPALCDAPLCLPTWCMRYLVDHAQYQVLNRACGGPNQGTAYVLVPPRVSRMHGKLAGRLPPDVDVDFAMLDWWFVAPPAVAHSFAAIASGFERYARQLRDGYPGIPLESH